LPHGHNTYFLNAAAGNNGNGSADAGGPVAYFPGAHPRGGGAALPPAAGVPAMRRGSSNPSLFSSGGDAVMPGLFLISRGSKSPSPTPSPGLVGWCRLILSNPR
jgi:hypothetical protein